MLKCLLVILICTVQGQSLCLTHTHPVHILLFIKLEAVVLVVVATEVIFVKCYLLFSLIILFT